MSNTMSIEEVQEQIIKLVIEIGASDFSGLIDPANIDKEREEACKALMAAHTWLGLAAHKESL